ncbi:hypothetical protein K443DRAFT_36454, partial [Laccaria amethystina LaAM-08-1]
LQVKRTTLSDRARGAHKSRAEAYEKRRLLTNVEEKTLLDWCDHSSAMAKPMDGSKLRGRALSVKGVYPGKNWARRFIKRHPTLVFGKPSGLDPNRWSDLEDKYGGIPPEHQWNMDEKGIQLGGGRKNNGRKFIFTRHHKNRYRIRS